MKTEKKTRQHKMVQIVPEKNLTETEIVVISLAILLVLVTIFLLFADVRQKANTSAGNGSNPATSKMVNDTKESGHDVGNGRIISADPNYVMPARTASDLQKAGFGTNFHQLEIASTNTTAIPQRTAGK